MKTASPSHCFYKLPLLATSLTPLGINHSLSVASFTVHQQWATSTHLGFISSCYQTMATPIVYSIISKVDLQKCISQHIIVLCKTWLHAHLIRKGLIHCSQNSVKILPLTSAATGLVQQSAARELSAATVRCGSKLRSNRNWWMKLRTFAFFTV